AIREENGGGSIGIGFSIPIFQVEFILENVKKYGRPKIGWLGVQGQTFTPGMAAAMKTTRGGVIVSGVIAGSPAEKAGLQIGDV
ncbi:PDZ domain-containing protein, partial [[Ruminococcus] torques]